MGASQTDRVAIVAPASRYHLLDGVRGLAALVVMLFHYLIDPTKYPFISNSYVAVDLFFILSGFVIYHSYADKLSAGMKPGAFINQRFARLAPTVAVGVVLGAMATLAFFHATGQSADPAKFALVQLGHVLFIPDLIDYTVPVTGISALFPSNHPLWSIFFEFIASICFVWLVRLPKWALLPSSIAMFGLLMLGCSSVAIATHQHLTLAVGWSPGTFLLGFPRVLFGFLAGMAICAFTKNAWSSSARPPTVYRGLIPALTFYALTLAVLLCPFSFWDAYPFIAAGVFCPLLILIGARLHPASPVLVRVSDGLGQLSFPLYCVHVPVRTLVEALMGGVPWKLQIVLSIVLSVIVSILLLKVIEGLRVRQRLSKVLRPITG